MVALKPEVASFAGDLFTDEVIRDPYLTYRHLRDAGPAVWLSAHNAWAVSRYDDVHAVLGDHGLFSSYPFPGFEPDRPEVPKGGLLGSDPPDHTRLRSILSEHTSPRALRKLRADIEEQADSHVATLVALGEFDIVQDLAQPFPIKIVSDLVGLPVDGRDNLLILADAGFNAFGPANERYLKVLPNIPRVIEYVGTAMSRENIAPNSWGAAVHDAVDAGRARPDETFHLLSGFVVAGMDTTISATGSAIWLLATHPEAWAALRANPSLAGQVFEETLRFESPVRFFARGATRDTMIGDVPIAEGDRVVAMYASANRDERRFADPDRFDISRRSGGHLAFGYGIHSCLGQGLARIEGPAILAALARRVARIELTAEPERYLSNTIRALKSAPARVIPA